MNCLFACTSFFFPQFALNFNIYNEIVIDRFSCNAIEPTFYKCAAIEPLQKILLSVCYTEFSFLFSFIQEWLSLILQWPFLSWQDGDDLIGLHCFRHLRDQLAMSVDAINRLVSNIDYFSFNAVDVIASIMNNCLEVDLTVLGVVLSFERIIGVLMLE